MPSNDRTLTQYDDLEARAAGLEVVNASGDAVEATVKRRFLLLDLEAQGLFEPELSAQITSILPSLPFLRGYRDAAVRLRSYLSGAVRSKFMRTEPPRSLTASQVSLDWFRFPQPIPQGFEEQEWLAYCEFSMTGIEPSSGGGEILFKVHGALCTLRWRLEDGIHPAIFAVSF
jgi:hypothetical protein